MKVRVRPSRDGRESQRDASPRSARRKCQSSQSGAAEAGQRQAEDLLEAIGRAKAVGRDRWYELKLLLDESRLEVREPEAARGLWP